MKLNGRKMLRAIGKYEDRCEKATEKQIPRMGKRAPLCYEYLGQLLAYADLIGSCAFSCPGKSEDAHAVWYLVARTSSFGRAALRLTKMGFYDEALIIVRSMGEICNLLSLFSLAPETIDEWKTSDRTHRLVNFSPSKIRNRIAALGKTSAITATRYAALCEVSTHPVPNLRPQRFNHAGRSMTGGIYLQEAGILVVLNEMAIALALLVILAAKICKVPTEPFNQIKETCVKCLESAGGVDLESLDQVWKQMEEGKSKHQYK
jgi:hypothetical protein